MDKTDVILSMLLLTNSRTSYRELSEKLNLSANAIHKRITALVDSGVISKFTTKISLQALQATIVIVHGKSEAESVGNLHEKLSKHDSIYWVTLGGGNYVYIGAYLKSASETGSLVDFVRKEAHMPNPIVGIFPMPPSDPRFSLEKMLYLLDRQIIYSLSNDSRKAISDIAEELMVTTKTVRRRLSAMTEKNLVEFSIHWYPDASNDIITAMHVRLKPAADKNTVSRVLKSYFPNIVSCFEFVNLPNEPLCLVWTSTMKELKEIQQRLSNEDVVSSVVSNILYTGYIFDTWRDELVRPKGTLT